MSRGAMLPPAAVLIIILLGQSAGLVQRIEPAAEVMAQLVRELHEATERMKTMGAHNA